LRRRPARSEGERVEKTRETERLEKRILLQVSHQFLELFLLLIVTLPLREIRISSPEVAHRKYLRWAISRNFQHWL
jgi:hypothetical protein